MTRATSPPSSTTSKSRMSTLQGFKQGITQPSGVSILIAVAFAGVTILMGCKVANEDWVADNGWLFVRGNDDTYGRITQRALQLRVSHSERPAVIALGDTLSQDVSPASQEGSLFETSGNPEIHDLRTSSQSLWEALALSDQIPRHTTGAVLLELSPACLASGRKMARSLDLEPKFGFRSPAMTVELQRLQQPTVPVRGNYLLDNYLYLFRRLPTALKNSYLSQDNSETPLGPSKPNSDPATHAEKFDPESEHENLTQNLALLERLIDKLQSTRLVQPVVVFDSGYTLADTTAEGSNREEVNLYEKILAIANRRGITLLRAGETSYDNEELSPSTVAIVRRLLKDIALQHNGQQTSS